MMVQPEVEARKALQALFAARTPPGSSQPITGELAAEREQAGIALRQLFKSEFRRALPSPVAVDQLKEVEKEVFRSLEQVTPLSNFKPPPRQLDSKSRSGVTVDVQTVAIIPTPRPIEEPVYEPPRQLPELPKIRRCVELEHRTVVEPLKKKVNEAQLRIRTLDAETTRLTRAVKLRRIKIWEHQRNSCSAEREVDRILAECTDEIPEAMRLEHARILEEESAYLAELNEVRQQAQARLKVARHQDAMLQQERDATRGEVHRILQRHPCGEVFIPPMFAGDSDDDSDDDYARYASRDAARMPRRADRVQLGSSDEDMDDDDDRPPIGADDAMLSNEGPRPPPPPAPGFRATSYEDDDNESEASSVTSPSSGGGGPSPSNSRLLASSTSTAQRKAPGPISDESYTSSDDEGGKASEPTIASQSAGQSESRESTSVPPLPELSGLSPGSVPKAKAPDVDDVEEVSSEEDWDAESGSSRSV